MRNEICDNPIKNYICDNLWMKIERLKMVIDDKKPHPRFATKMGSKKTQINDIQKKPYKHVKQKCYFFII